MKINCVNKKCVFNVEGICKKDVVNIEGMFARNKIGTFCTSFMNKDNNCCNLDYETENNTVKCDADNCKYCKNGYCTKEILQITGYDTAIYRSETQCDGFECKKGRLKG